MKMPEPIIEPHTIIVESKRPEALHQLGCWLPATPAIGTRRFSHQCRSPNLRETARASNFRRDAQIFRGAFRGLPRRNQIANHRDRIRACTIHRLRVLRCDSANRHERFCESWPARARRIPDQPPGPDFSWWSSQTPDRRQCNPPKSPSAARNCSKLCVETPTQRPPPQMARASSARRSSWPDVHAARIAKRRDIRAIVHDKSRPPPQPRRTASRKSQIIAARCAVLSRN